LAVFTAFNILSNYKFPNIEVLYYQGVGLSFREKSFKLLVSLYAEFSQL
jgi:hypothetical protein